MSELLLEASHVGRTFETKKGRFTALNDVHLTIHQHEFVSLLGPSGCGKSTFLRLVAGLDQITDGTIVLNGQPITRPGRDRGVVFQQYSLLPWLLAWENVAFALKKDRLLNKKQKKELAYHFLKLVGLEGFETVYPSQMSGGMQQRVAIARALVFKPKLLLMDEPFGALDAQTRRDMQDLLVKVFKEAQSSVLFVTHDIDEAVYLSDRVYVMASGPGRNAKELTIELPDARDWSLQLTEPFIAYKKEIILELQKQRREAAEKAAATR
ncbi:ABC transporter ATP-binding protein [Sporolactobacillus spathodeae]|uniref:ABC-type nitrate/sulfonate/bicarbonate transport system ATPase subunit n=1 Tax=Sporolactobacillus spathodeae TaxID=1465502 RepID=A0ABS2Q8R8_9BACL|nr:ABC transporter ATP-binding protein [Sporolactobacillus spathodeae]MBM7658138.1 ABC-type nitrate/sulfonate/bicarbonate transport system ATPase subunit [Sporolactobacillus spathodeae]